ncbi:MAG: P1 family peptidase [Candidatus Sungbacteria bacterium]|nr:P1 family peptidase [Candidatus Sungbacteria bacterium]
MMNPVKKKRFREYGYAVGMFPTGIRNAISDVFGVKVGHCTKIAGADVRTGLTLIDPGIEGLYRTKLKAAIAVGNGFGKLAGITQVAELGTLETPIALTNTLAVGPVMRGVVDLVIKHTPDIGPADTVNAVVGETNDGFLNVIHRDIISKEDVFAAYDARIDEVAEGCVGAGTGTRLFSWKGGIGTSSRIVTAAAGRYALGALVQTNFGGALTVLGMPVGQKLGKTDFAFPGTGDGSCMIVLACDAPLSSRQLQRVARRAFLALGRVGSVMAHGSGDYAIAFSTACGGANAGVADTELTPFFLGAVEATEEAIYNALFAAETMSGRDGNILEAISHEQVIALLRERERISEPATRR